MDISLLNNAVLALARGSATKEVLTLIYEAGKAEERTAWLDLINTLHNKNKLTYDELRKHFHEVQI